MRRRYRDRITVRNAPLIGGYGGQEIRDWDNAEETLWPADVSPVSTPDEQENARDFTTARWWLHAPAGVLIDYASRVIWDDPAEPMAVEGEVQVAHSNGHPHHLEALLVRAKDRE